MAEELAVLLDGTVAGRIRLLANNLLVFEYADAYRAMAGATPLSVSMPTAVRVHADTPARRVVTAFLAGLLPDNDATIRRWAAHYQVRTSSPFHILGTPVGRDCAGAVSFCPVDEVDDLLARGGSIEWLTDSDVGALLHDLRRDATTLLGVRFTGQFSLAGAQGKTALVFDGTRWGRPSGAEPTTHILKPAASGWTDQDLNEHLCLRAASEAGLAAAETRIERFGDASAIVVRRYDRVVMAGAADGAAGGGIRRIHQEDMCQALGVPPDRKYEHDGGPSERDIASVLRRVMPRSDADAAVLRFADALAWNWLIGGTDAHAKNYSILLAGQSVRLAPLYDVSSILPYVGQRSPASGEVIEPREVRLAMRIGRTYDLEPPRNPWVRAAADLGLDGDVLVARVRDLARDTPDAFATAARDLADLAGGSQVITALVDGVGDRSRRCLEALGG